MKSGPWSEDDLDTLRLYAGQGRSVYRIAAALSRSVSGVRAAAYRHGITIRSARMTNGDDKAEAATPPVS